MKVSALAQLANVLLACSEPFRPVLRRLRDPQPAPYGGSRRNPVRRRALATGCLTGGRIASGSSPTLAQLIGNDWFRRVSPVAAYFGDRLLSEPTAGI